MGFQIVFIWVKVDIVIYYMCINKNKYFVKAKIKQLLINLICSLKFSLTFREIYLTPSNFQKKNTIFPSFSLILRC